MKLYEYLIDYGIKEEDHLFYRDDDSRLTYGEALHEAQKLADFLLTREARGKVAAFYGADPKDQLLFFLAAEMVGPGPCSSMNT